jgi:hypothetical protein
VLLQSQYYAACTSLANVASVFADNIAEVFANVNAPLLK